MRKKKPKKSPSSSPPKSANYSPPPPAIQTSLMEIPTSKTKDSALEGSLLLSDAQIDSSADNVAQQAEGLSDLISVVSKLETPKTVIVRLTTDPSSVESLAPTAQTESSSADIRRSSSADDVVLQDIISEKSTVDISPLIATADAEKVFSSSQQAAVKSVISPSDYSNTDSPNKEDPELASADAKIDSLSSQHAGNLNTTIDARRAADPKDVSGTDIKAAVIVAEGSAPTVFAHPESRSTRMMSNTKLVLHSKLGTEKDKVRGEISATPDYLQSSSRKVDIWYITPHSDVQPDSSDEVSLESDLEEGELK
ncbi:hypothetical protein DY000_02055758 [Brassica cretica]|uniref:Uncharacterized protein n=1 Tax=Brassica cretica TaxID=69181 RepID=A0ABQ7A626_BRACR|nr:hypothetical protein DY000_02055758 [Brassica cretica]